MIATNILRQLLATKLQLSCPAGAIAVAAASLLQQQHFAAGQHRGLADVAVEVSAAETSSPPPSSATSGPSQSQAWAPARSLPPPSTYSVKITIKAHELKFVKLASTVIRDLVLVNFAPKSRDVLPQEWRPDNAAAPWVNLTMNIGDASLPIRRSHYTVISGPHVHKTAREQFARTTHTRVIQAATNNLSELNWLLDSIKMYRFVGAEIAIRVTSSSYLLPTSTAQQDAAQQPLLAEHKQRFADLFGAAAPSTSTSSSSPHPGPSSSSSSSYAALQQSLQSLSAGLREGLLHQRVQLSSSSDFGRWRDTLEGKQAAQAATAVAAATARLPKQVMQDVVAQQVEGSSLAGKEEQQQQEHAFLAAVDKALMSMKTEVLDRHKLFPFLMAFYQPGQHQVPAAEWMQAMLLLGKHKQQEVDASQQQAALQAYEQYGQVSQALLLLLLQQWYRAADAAGRQQLAMPSAEEVEKMLQQLAGHQAKQLESGSGSSDTAELE